MKLELGMTGEATTMVVRETSAAYLGAGGVEVFATPMMILLMGVAKTSTPPAPKYAAEFSRTTMVVASPVMPSSSFMYIAILSFFSFLILYNNNLQAW